MRGIWKKILVIDDEPVIRILLRQLFDPVEYAVIDACNAKQVLITAQAMLAH